MLYNGLSFERLRNEAGFEGLYVFHWWLTCFVAIVLLVSLVAVLVLGFGHKGGTLRKL